MEDIPQAITPKEEKDMKLIEEKEFQLNFNEDIFILKIGENMSKKNIIMKISNTTKLEDIFYEHYFDFDELVKLDRTFRLYDELEEIFSTLITCLNEKKIIIKEVKNDEIILGLKIIMPMTGKEKIIDLKLNKKELEKDSIIKELCKKINILEEENKNLKNETKSLKDEIKVIKDELNVIKKWKEDNEKEKENKKKLKSVIDSKILAKFEDYQFIEKIYRDSDKNFINKKLKMKLLYRVSRDGDSSSTFHQKCDNIKDTITLVKTKNDLIFGGYTNETWNGSDYKKDDKAFCFSIDLKKKYNNKKTDYSIYCTKGYGPCFGAALFWIQDNCLSKGGFMNDGLNQNYDNQIKKNEINFGNGNFNVIDVEVYEAKFE